MISGIKIYDSNGILKEEISKQKAIALYDEKNKKNWCLSPSERKTWDRLSAVDGKLYKKVSISSKRGPGLRVARIR